MDIVKLNNGDLVECICENPMYEWKKGEILRIEFREKKQRIYYVQNIRTKKRGYIHELQIKKYENKIKKDKDGYC